MTLEGQEHRFSNLTLNFLWEHRWLDVIRVGIFLLHTRNGKEVIMPHSLLVKIHRYAFDPILKQGWVLSHID